MRGADRLIAALQAQDASCVFGLPGGASLAIHDALLGSPIRHVLVRHEAAAGHAAEGWARATGSVGVALVTSGPGATNLATPIADAHMDPSRRSSSARRSAATCAGRTRSRRPTCSA